MVFGVKPEIDFDELRSDAFEAFQAELQTSSFSRKQKRSLTSKFRSMHSDIRNLLHDHIVQNKHKTKDNIIFQIVSREISYRWIVKDIGNDVLYSTLVAKMRDPHVVYDIGSRTEGQLEQIFGLMRLPSIDLIGQFETNMISLIPIYAKEKQENDARGKLTPEPKTIFNRIIEKQLLLVIDDRLDNLSKSERTSVIDNCPSVKISYFLLKNYLVRAVQAVATGDPNQVRVSIGKPSFVQDWLHLSYSPYVDVFRADRGTNALIRNHTNGTNANIVESIQKLNELARCYKV